jgi:hypothetical protein
MGAVGSGHVDGASGVGHSGAAALSGLRGTTPSAVQSLVSRHIGFPTAGAWREQYVRQADQDHAAVADCIRRFKSYDVFSGTYLSRGGRRRACP